MQIIVVTGMSGAGKSSVLRLFEDMGYYCMDNLPPRLIMNFVDLARQTGQDLSRVAMGVDIRGGEFFEDLQSTIDRLKEENGISVSLVFVTAADEVLVQRYKELRRPHPMDKAGNIFDGIQREKAILEDLRLRSNYVIDTSRLTLGELKATIDRYFLPEGQEAKLLISVTSFGFKNGIALDADLVFDVRFIKNPFYIPELKNLNGTDPELQEYVTSFPETEIFMDKLRNFLSFLIPLYIKEGKRTLNIALGCTGGWHRSVALAEILTKELKEKYNRVHLAHRDRDNWKKY